ncbi:MAG: hypothetical protein MK132_14210 [Lentisphaerales bacterium]|nr:hypothetical protein [Lentisphaerales bacterium]
MSEKLREFLIEIGLAVNSRCRLGFTSETSLSTEVKTSPSDIIYQIDVEAEEVIIQMMEDRAADFGGILLLAEGIGDNDTSVYPTGLAVEEAQTKIICDPIDGSRGLMYGKRPAFFLAAAGPVNSKKLSDLDVSVMVELPIPKQGEWDVLSAIRNSGFRAERYNETGNQGVVNLSPSENVSIEGGFFSMAKFCYPGKGFISEIEEELLDSVFEARDKEYLPVFEDQYISSGGQLYELICGHDCFVGDFRASMYDLFKKQGLSKGQICHPYDMAGLLVAKEVGVHVTDIQGNEFDALLNTTDEVDWFGYANAEIRQQIEKPLLSILESKDLI